VYLHHKANLPLAPKLFLKNRKKKVLGCVVGAKKNPKNENNNKSKLHSGGQKIIQKIIDKENPYDCVIKN
jgi:hypothetical protein